MPSLKTLPINHELKWIYKDRWFRIHNLPNSKRYAENQEEYQIILDRQNKIIEDIIGSYTEIVTIFGQYSAYINNEYHKMPDYKSFIKIQSIDLHLERPEKYEEQIYYDVYAKIESWLYGSKNRLLKSIADDEIRAMIVCPSKNYIVAPYDGGMDIIVNTTAERNRLKEKYKTWLSDRLDGL